MRKLIITLLVIAAPITVSAQLKVSYDGKLKVGTTANLSDDDEVSNALVSISNHPSYVWEDYAFHKMGVEAILKPSTTSNNVGVLGEVYGTTNNSPWICTGVWGVAGGSSHGANYGVSGGIYGDTGAGVYGTTGSEADDYFTGKYAGYFNGDSYMNGNLTVQGLYNLSDMRLKENVTLFSESARGRGGALDNLLGMEVIEYNLKNVRQAISGDRKHVETAEEKEARGRRHFGVSAQELQKVYPNLVLEGQDGFLAVNYTELVPVLIRSIQELKEQLDEVRSAAGEAQLSRGTTAIASNAAPASANVLYQNTPNPFKEKTTIRFSLAGDARDAAICIFDLSGKMLKKLPISSGETSVSINGYELGEGMFLYTLLVNGQEMDTKRMIITK